MGKASKKPALRPTDRAVVEFIEAAAIGDLRTVKKLAKAAICEVDAGERERDGGSESKKRKHRNTECCCRCTINSSQ